MDPDQNISLLQNIQLLFERNRRKINFLDCNVRKRRLDTFKVFSVIE